MCVRVCVHVCDGPGPEILLSPLHPKTRAERRGARPRGREGSEGEAEEEEEEEEEEEGRLPSSSPFVAFPHSEIVQEVAIKPRSCRSAESETTPASPVINTVCS